MGLILFIWGLIDSHFALNNITNPCSLLSRNRPLLGICTYINSPQNTPFPDLTLKVGNMKYSLGKMDPNWAKCLKSGQKISRSGQIKMFIHKVSFQSS